MTAMEGWLEVFVRMLRKQFSSGLPKGACFTSLPLKELRSASSGACY